MTTELTQDILSELHVIKWLLIIVAIVALYFTFLFFSAMKRLESGKGVFGKQIHNKKRENELQEMLAKGDAIGAKFTALEWTNSRPNEAWAHWYLAKAYDQLGEYVETKKVLTHLRKISPNWNNSIEPWLESVEEHLTPKSVK